MSIDDQIKKLDDTLKSAADRAKHLEARLEDFRIKSMADSGSWWKTREFKALLAIGLLAVVIILVIAFNE